MQNFVHHKRLLVVVLLLALSALACQFSVGGTGGPAEADLVATRAALGATQTALAAPPPQESEAKEADQIPPVTFNGASLLPPPGWTFTARTEPADEAFEAFWSTPEHDLFEAQGYPVTNDYHAPAIRVFSVQAYSDFNELAVERVSQLRALLEARPALPAGAPPFLPVFNAAQLGQAKMAFLDFQNGSGIRFLTQFGQAFWPFNNRGMVYAFIGLTDDGRYLVSALMPLAHPALDIYDDFQPADDFYDDAETFLRGQVDMLNAQPDSSFLPSLELLDGLLASVRVDK